MSDAANLSTDHLAPGETLVWSGSASIDLRKAETSRRRLLYGLAGISSLVIALMLSLRFVESIAINAAQASMLAAFTPLYIVFALAMFALSLWGFRKMLQKLPAAAHFAVTSQRLIALDGSGAIVGQLPGAEIETVIAGGRRRTPDVYVLRRDDPKEERAFAMEFLERPLEAKAIIEETFPIEAAPEEEDPS